MAVFQYTARDQMGRVITGVLEAENGAQVASRLREMGLFITAIEPLRTGPGEARGLLDLLRGISLRELALMSRQFATMVNSGLSLVRALSILEQQATNPKLRRILAQVRADVEQGRALADAMAKHPQAFSSLYVNMVRAGEAGGVLDDVLQRLSTFLEKEYALRQKIRSAMVYPVILAVVATLALLFMTVFIIPQFVVFYRELNVGDLPVPTQILMWVSLMIRSFWYLWVPALALGAYGLRRWIRTPAGKAWWDRAKLHLPLFGPLVQKAILARFARTLGTLLGAGVPLLQAFEVTGKAVDNVVVEEGIQKVRSSIREGESIAVPLSSIQLFPPMVVQMVRVGEEAGNLDEMLVKVADFYDTEVEATVGALASTLEPTMIVFMAAVVGAMVISLYLPIFKLVAQAG
ncbi:MAG: type II secretion system F family protein [Armatimonadota bacterium]|nr:type II secretion system F family protein [Armatimonadota bacterium]MDR7445158.1 type II secretion system F family protein [Armatimonadota bacterium]MDR7571245.1 type II secretion system F family protein [Armatimonadota bacterium]MDR7613985.1 type II secretion system F family protein [Armatimonadota bacterium]